VNTRFRVWAPRAVSVDLLTEGDRRAAMPVAGGWWTADPPAPGADYSISVDGGPARPDPRSVEQPRGVLAPSRWPSPAPSPAPFAPLPLADGVVYELHVGTFTAAGTFDAAIEHLDHVAALGVTHVELMPIAAFSGRHGWGYDGVDLYAVHAPYGGPAGLRRLIDACHQRRLGVILDVVYNHLGPEGDYLADVGPYFAPRARTPWGAAFDLSEPAVRAYFLDNAQQWLDDFAIDGLRLDATHALIDDTPRHLLAELTEEVRALERATGRTIALIGEHEEQDRRLIDDADGGGCGLDALWYDDLHHALRGAITHEGSTYLDDRTPLGNLARALTLGCDDVRRTRWRRVETPHGHVDGRRLIASIQNHAQIGGRPHGERLGQLTSAGRLRFGVALLFLSPFVPMIFQGDEWGASTPFHYFVEHQDAALRRAVREGRRRDLADRGWDTALLLDPSAPEAHRASILDWREPQRGRHASVIAWYRALIALRRRCAALRDGRRDAITCAWDERGRWFTYERGPISLVANLSRTAPARLPRPSGVRVLAYPEPPSETRGAIILPPDAIAIYERA